MNAGTLQVGALGAIPNETALTVGNSASAAMFDLNGYNLTVSALNGSVGAGAKLITSSSATPNATATLTVDNAAANTYAGNIANGTGAVALTKLNSGTLTLTSNESFTGPTTINGGTLSISNNNGSAPGRLAGTTGITINNGGVLLLTGGLANIDRINNAANVTIASGGKLSTGGFSEGSSVALSTPGMSALTLQGNSTIDFVNTALGSTLLAATGTISGAGVISILNWSGAANGDSGVGGNDRLLYATDPAFTAAQLLQFQFSDDAGNAYPVGGTEISYHGFTEIVPVPEPATWLGGLLAAGFGGRGRLAAGR